MAAFRHTVRDATIAQSARFTRKRRSGATTDTVVVVQPDHLGDVLFSLPAVKYLRSEYPDSRLVGIVGPWSEAIARRVWDVDKIEVFPFPAFDRNHSEQSVISAYFQLLPLARLISGHMPRAVVVMRPDDWWSAWAASISNSGEIFTSTDRRVDPFSTRRSDIPEGLHAVERAFAIASGGAPSIAPATHPLRVPRDDSDCSGFKAPYVVIHPGSGADVKLWPPKRWRNVASRLVSDGFRVVVTGSNSEIGLANEVVDGVVGAVSVAGKTSLDELIQILSGATLVAGPDCGPLHLAVACSAPTVHLFGPSDPVRYGPWGDPARNTVISAGWNCSRCGDLSPSRPSGCGCMLAINVDQVTNAIRDVVGRNVP